MSERCEIKLMQNEINRLNSFFVENEILVNFD